MLLTKFVRWVAALLALAQIAECVHKEAQKVPEKSDSLQ
jgi:hypothetical protein